MGTFQNEKALSIQVIPWWLHVGAMAYMPWIIFRYRLSYGPFCCKKRDCHQRRKVLIVFWAFPLIYWLHSS